MKRLKEWWQKVVKAIDHDVDAHIAELIDDTTYQPLRNRLNQEVPEIIAELESVTKRLRELISE